MKRVDVSLLLIEGMMLFQVGWPLSISSGLNNSLLVTTRTSGQLEFLPSAVSASGLETSPWYQVKCLNVNRQALQSDSFSSEMSGNATIGHKLILTLVKFIGGLQRNSNSNSSLLEQFSFIQPLKLPIYFTGSVTNRVGRVVHYFNLHGVDVKRQRWR